MARQSHSSETSEKIRFALHARGLLLTKSHWRTIERILGTTLGRFSHRMHSIDVWLEDVNGPRGGVDIRCRLDVQMRSGGKSTVSALAIDEYAATAKAAVRAREFVDRRVKKARGRRRQLVHA